ncbi:MAG: BamA/TamA family outer membrane protein, partial [Candidatus Polarisedimenticolia bacterium]
VTATPGAAAAPSAARTTLVFRPTDKPWGPNYLRFGVNFLNDFQGDTDFSVLGRLTRTRINALGAEWRTDGQFGETRRLSTEFYQPLDFTGTFFVVPRFSYSFFNTDVFDGDRNLATYRTRHLAGWLSLGAQIGRYGEVRLGAARGRVDARERIGPGTLPEFDGDLAGWTGRVVFDRLDDSNFPHGGRLILLEAFLARRGLGSELDYDKLSGGVVQVWSRGRHHAFVSLSAGTNLGSTIPFFDEYRMGGLFNLSGFREGQIRGQMFGVTRFGWYRRSGKLSGIFGRGIYVGAWLEAGNAWQTRDAIGGDTLHYTGTAALGVDTFFGPLYFAYGRSDGGHDVVYLSLGRSLGGPRLFDL